MSRILAIDPGTYQSGWVVYDTKTRGLFHAGITDNAPLSEFIVQESFRLDHFCIEMVQNYGRIVGRDVFETALWVGRFCQTWLDLNGTPYGDHSQFCITRPEVKLHLLNSASGNDTQIRAAIEDLYGGRLKAIGGVKCRKCKGKGWFGAGRPVCPVCNGDKWLHPPGPLHGIEDHMWSALGVALTFAARDNQNGNT